MRNTNFDDDNERKAIINMANGLAKMANEHERLFITISNVSINDICAVLDKQDGIIERQKKTIDDQEKNIENLEERIAIMTEGDPG